MKKGLYKFILSFVVIISAITFIAPFSIKADRMPVAPFVALNWYIENYDNEFKMTLSNGTGTLTVDGTNSSIVQGEFTSGGRTYYSTGMAPSGTSGLNINGTISLNNSGTTTQVVKRIIHCDIILDNNYVGTIGVRVKNSDNIVYFSQQLGVNGNTISFQFVDNIISDNVEYNTSFDNILLTENNNGERWSFPIESFSVSSFALNNLSLIGLDNYNTYYLPMFNLSNNVNIMEYYAQPGREYEFIFFISKNIYNLQTALDNFTISNGYIKNYKLINRFYGYNNQLNYVIKLTLDNNTDYGKSIITWNGGSNYKYIPIYGGYSDVEYISTDFALQFNLDNTLLKKLDLIANGNTQSNNSSSQADNTNSQASQIFSQEEQLVNNAEQDLQDNLNELNIQNQNNNLFGNSKFIASANWVRTQFNSLTNNNAFGYLITFSLVIGLALVIIGKLRV